MAGEWQRCGRKEGNVGHAHPVGTCTPRWERSHTACPGRTRTQRILDTQICHTAAGSGGIQTAQPRTLPAAVVNPEGRDSCRHRSHHGTLHHDTSSLGTAWRQSSETRAAQAAGEGRTGGRRHHRLRHAPAQPALPRARQWGGPPPTRARSRNGHQRPPTAATCPCPRRRHPHPQAGDSPAASHWPHPSPRGCRSSCRSQAGPQPASPGTATTLGTGSRAPLHDADAAAGRRHLGPAGRPAGSVGGDAAGGGAARAL
ncbi:uncharacterized protein LOC126049794 [Accipiter gentilis]|uniref:uncharacterized protein LOC126049794 n=1 Tax=Astur gentilis TaxID=8957 RepID=UPI00211092B0|nr:uncharacterized protein LOC126049794 [Accipiter gentilis]